MHSRGPDEPYIRQFSATVDRLDSTHVVLDTTYFYPEGGGQPADRGTLDGIDVVAVQSRDGEVLHELAREPDFSVGDAVDGVVDDEFRTYCMRAHTASHALYGAGRRLLDDLGYGGFGITEDRVRVDLTTTTDVDDATLVELERLVNRVVWDSRQVTWEERDRETALADDEIAFNTKTEEGLESDSVRVVTIEDWDVAACGGTHVENTSEIGPVAVLDRSNPGEGLTRVEFAVGPAAIERRADDHEAALASARKLDTSVADLPDAVERLQADREETRAELDALRDELVETRLAALQEDAVEKAGRRWVVGAVPGLDANGLADRAQDAVGDGADVVALVSEDGQYLAVATAGEVDAGDVVDDVTADFGGGGGGGPTVAQGGGLGAPADEIVTFLRETAE
ncbi:DHHA1 domain-containing protein [Halorientalis brevis]|uniref:DHHA1 domain-containing protein n=1 Tax=Halorientalis brevis TaxID=1126241 RepID=A0ABD6CFZ6_9EURY|nr:DHHA1 domain-containing protein [Halorientalis brevis]